MTPVEKHITNKFLIQYGAPDTIDPAEFVAEYERALSGSDTALLIAAAARVIDKHTFRNWPTVGECVAAVNAIATERAADALRRAPPQPSEPRPAYSAGSTARVGALLNETVQNLKAVDDNRPGSPHKFDWSKTSKPEFEKTQVTSPNAYLHRKWSKP